MTTQLQELIAQRAELDARIDAEKAAQFHTAMQQIERLCGQADIALDEAAEYLLESCAKSERAQATLPLTPRGKAVLRVLLSGVVSVRDIADALRNLGGFTAAQTAQSRELHATERTLVMLSARGFADVADSGEWSITPNGVTLLARAKVPPKYRHKATGATWTGRGKQPRWYAEADQSEIENLIGDLA